MYYYMSSCNLSPKSETFIDVIIKQYSSLIKAKSTTPKYMKMFYNILKKADNYAKNSDKTVQLKQVNNIHDIKLPSLISDTFFPKQIQKHIKEACLHYYITTITINSRKINIYFYICNPMITTTMIQNRLHKIIMWLYIACTHAPETCVKTLSIFLYFTAFKKKLPNNSLDAVGPIHVNSAYTTPCTTNAEIVIYREEEWFKVFIHETFHTFGLDFSDVNYDSLKTPIKNTFPIQSEFNIEESYCEFWARSLNIMFFSYFNSLNLYKNFKLCFDIHIDLEKIHSSIQLNKILHFFGLSYDHLCDPKLHNICNKLYKEQTNVFAYYILTSVLLYHFNDMLHWCNNNNTMIFRFNKNKKYISSYFSFIIEKYKSPEYINSLRYIKQINNNIQNNNPTLRMSLIEFN